MTVGVELIVEVERVGFSEIKLDDCLSDVKKVRARSNEVFDEGDCGIEAEIGAVKLDAATVSQVTKVDVLVIVITWS